MDYFKIGENVRLKSSDITMTITEGNRHTQKYLCQWIDSDGQTHAEWYPPEALEPFEDTD